MLNQGDRLQRRLAKRVGDIGRCLAGLGIASLVAAGPALALITPIELTPANVGSGNPNVFTVLPTTNPGLFGLTGPDVRFVDFDFDADGNPIASGASITNQYAPLGVVMNGFQVVNNVFGGPASAPNATTTSFNSGVQLIFTFTVPVVAFGAINTSPDADVLEFWSGPNGTGALLFSFADQGGTGSPNFNVDRFIGGFIDANTPIGSVVYKNTRGQDELDEFIFQVELDFFERVPEPGALALISLGLTGLAFVRRGRLERRR
jgi:hypothetical protein